MKNIFIYILILILSYFAEVSAKDNFFEEAKNLFERKKYEKSKFLFQRSIVFNPKHANSYLYLAKIYNYEKNEKEELKNLKTTLLLQPNNEEAMFMLINIELEKSNFSEVRDLTSKFQVICLNLCNETEEINQRLKDIEAKSFDSK